MRYAEGRLVKSWNEYVNEISKSERADGTWLFRCVSSAKYILTASIGGSDWREDIA